MNATKTKSHGKGRVTLPVIVLSLSLSLTVSPFFARPAQAIDPQYQSEMRRLNEVMGSLYFLQPLCGETSEDWLAHATELLTLDIPDQDREERLIGAFNSGYEAFARLYRWCSAPAHEAMVQLLVEAERTARSIHSRYAE